MITSDAIGNKLLPSTVGIGNHTLSFLNNMALHMKLKIEILNNMALHMELKTEIISRPEKIK